MAMIACSQRTIGLVFAELTSACWIDWCWIGWFSIDTTTLTEAATHGGGSAVETSSFVSVTKLRLVKVKGDKDHAKRREAERAAAAQAEAKRERQRALWKRGGALQHAGNQKRPAGVDVDGERVDKVKLRLIDRPIAPGALSIPHTTAPAHSLASFWLLLHVCGSEGVSRGLTESAWGQEHWWRYFKKQPEAHSATSSTPSHSPGAMAVDLSELLEVGQSMCTPAHVRFHLQRLVFLHC